MMKRMIFLCVFHNSNYLRLLDLCLESLFSFGRVCTETTDVVVYTSTAFHHSLRTKKWYPHVRFVLEDSKKDVKSACEARLDIFHLPITRDYDTILYLDTDILILKDIDPIFDLVEKDKIHAIEEGIIRHDFWGGVLFDDAEIRQYPQDQKGFNSGVLLFSNTPIIARMFEEVRRDIVRRPYNLFMHDQPYLNYHGLRSGLVETQKLKDVIELRLTRHRTLGDKRLIHFIGGEYSHAGKGAGMRRVLQQRYRLHQS